MILDTSETLNLQPTLMMILHDGAVGYLQCRDHLDPLKYPSQYRPLIQQQNTIGWLNFLQGRWSNEWKRLQFQYNQSLPPPKTKKDKQKQGKAQKNWTVTMIRQIWDSIYTLWEQRNKDLHGSDTQSQYNVKRQLYTREIQHYYELKHTYPSHLQTNVFNTPLETLLQKKNYELYNWIELWTEVLDSNTEEDDAEWSLPA